MNRRTSWDDEGHCTNDVRSYLALENIKRNVGKASVVWSRNAPEWQVRNHDKVVTNTLNQLPTLWNQNESSVYLSQCKNHQLFVRKENSDETKQKTTTRTNYGSWESWAVFFFIWKTGRLWWWWLVGHTLGWEVNCARPIIEKLLKM